MKYIKPPKTIDEQVDLLKARGLIVHDENRLKFYLKNINYYHLSIYFKYFQVNDKFKDGVSFDDVLMLYLFDNKLRLLLVDLLERVEKSFKCRLAYELSLLRHDSHWFEDVTLFDSTSEHDNLLLMIEDEIAKNNRELAIAHYYKKYDNPKHPPIWSVVEILSFGQCIRICKQLKRVYRNTVSRTFGEDEKYIMNWMLCLSLLRNVCAHHTRLWNKTMTYAPLRTHKKYGEFFYLSGNSLYNYAVILQIVISKTYPTSTWIDKLRKLIEECKIDIGHMGFPSDWEERLQKIMIM